MLRRTAIWLMICFLVGGHPVGAGADTLDEIRASGVLIWGADPQGGAPYVFHDPENPAQTIGFEADLIATIADRMGVRPRLVEVDWTSLLPALKRGDFQVALNGLEWTAARARDVALSDPYYIYTQQLVARRDNATVHSLRDLPGKIVATLGGSVAGRLLERLPGVNVRHYEGQIEPYEDLRLRRVDAVLMDLPIANWYAGTDPQLEFRGPPFAEGLYVMAVRPGDRRLLDTFNQILGDLFEAGELRRIYQKWGLWNTAQLKLKDGDHSERRFMEQATGSSAHWLLLLKGAGMTVVLSVVSMTLAVLAGVWITWMRLSGNRLLKSLAVGYTEVMRGTPLLLQLYILYYGLPNIGIELNAFTAAVLGLGLNYAAYESEIYRAGLNAIPKGQAEAGLSLGMTVGQVYRRILIPQAIKTILPPATNDFIALFKDSSLVSIIALVELTKTYNMLAVSSMRYLELGILTAILYLAMSIPLSLLSTRLERRLA